MRFRATSSQLQPERGCEDQEPLHFRQFVAAIGMIDKGARASPTRHFPAEQTCSRDLRLRTDRAANVPRLATIQESLGNVNSN
jgi:hypothetical protein